MQVDCTGTAAQAATNSRNEEALKSMENLGAIDAVRQAEKVQSPIYRGKTSIKGLYDPGNQGSLTWGSPSYEKEHPGLGTAEPAR